VTTDVPTLRLNALEAIGAFQEPFSAQGPRLELGDAGYPLPQAMPELLLVSACPLASLRLNTRLSSLASISSSTSSDKSPTASC
jgi:hypothetical protein